MFKSLEHSCSNCLNKRHDTAFDDPTPPPRPLGRAFWRIWSAQTVSTLGSSVAGFGIAVHVFLDSGNALWLGLLIAAAGLPFVVLAPLLGRIDRFDRRTVMITGDSIAAVGTVVALAFALAGQARGVASRDRCGHRWHRHRHPDAGRASRVPALVDLDQLDRANGLGQIGPAGGIVAAPVIATVLVRSGGSRRS
jgi:MFS transporter, DHA3 family, macrolide efflux protein